MVVREQNAEKVLRVSGSQIHLGYGPIKPMIQAEHDRQGPWLHLRFRRIATHDDRSRQGDFLHHFRP